MSTSKADSLEAARRDAITRPDPGTESKCSNQTDWIEIVLKDQHDVPMPGEEYLVKAHGGTEYSGVLDQDGFARIEGVDPGDCDVSFPRLDQTEWKKRGA